MRQQYLVSWSGHGNMWVSEKDLLPKWKKKIQDFKLLPSTSSSSLPSLATPSIIAETKCGDLPQFAIMSASAFKWGSRDAVDFINDIQQTYEVTTKWRKNSFNLPSGQSGKQFTQALVRLFAAYGERSPIECIALKTPLLLQQPAGKPTYRDNVTHLLRRLVLWEEGKIIELLKEGATIQAQLTASAKMMDDSTLAKRFATMVFNNNFKGAMSLVTEKGKGGILALDVKASQS